MKNTFVIVLAIFMLLHSNTHITMATENPPVPSADSAILIDAETGTVLYSNNGDTSYPPASTTKIMTALLTLEKTKLEDKVIIGKAPPFADGSSIGVREGEIFTVKDLLYGLLLESGNDCAEALAEHIGGTKEKFAEMMNKRAKELGATNTNFVNPSGLYNKEHKSSAKDLALIMKELIKHPEFKEISSTQVYKINPTNKCDTIRYANNKNKLVLKGNSYYYEGVIGGKTGYTTESQHSYVAAAERNGLTLIVALVHDSKKTFYEDAIKLFNYGFNNFELKKLYSKGDEVTFYKINDSLSIPLLASKDFYYTAEKNSKETPTYKLSVDGIKTNSFVRGKKLTEATIYYKNDVLGILELASGIDYEIKPVITSVQNSKATTAPIIKIAMYAVSIFFLLFLILLMIRKRNIRRRKLRRYKYFSGKYK